MGPKMRSSEESSVGSGATSGQGNNGGGGRRGAARNRPRNQNHRQGRGGGSCINATEILAGYRIKYPIIPYLIMTLSFRWRSVFQTVSLRLRWWKR